MKYDDEDVRKRGKMGVWKRGEEGEEGGGVKVENPSYYSSVHIRREVGVWFQME